MAVAVDIGLRNNLSAAAAPAVTDDAASGYAVGSVWIDTTNDVAYTCVDATTGAAIWNFQISAGTQVIAGGKDFSGIIRQTNANATFLSKAMGYVETILTHAQILTLNSVPVSLVAAQGANTVIIPASIQWYANFTVAYAANTNLMLNTVGATIGVNGIRDTSALVSTVARVIKTAPTMQVTTAASVAFVPNAALQVTVATGDPTLGNAANTLKLMLIYEVHTIN